MTTESWLFLFAAIPAAGTLLAFFRIDALAIARLWRRLPSQGIPKQYTGRDIVISVLIVISLIFSGLGLTLTIGRGAPHLSDNQKRSLLGSVGPMRTFLSSIAISITNGDPETEPLAHDIASVFNRAGIEPDLVFTRPDNPDQSGVIVCVKDLNKPPLGIEELKAALKASDIKFKIQSFPSRGFPGLHSDAPLVIWVASGPALGGLFSPECVAPVRNPVSACPSRQPSSCSPAALTTPCVGGSPRERLSSRVRGART